MADIIWLQNLQGAPGPQGPIGNDGPQGEQGPQGIKGDTGNVGPVGGTGPKGDPGLTGRVLGYNTLALLLADLSPAQGEMGVVLSGTGVGQVYTKSGASGLGSWVLTAATFGTDAAMNASNLAVLSQLINNDFAFSTQSVALDPADGTNLEFAITDAGLRVVVGVNKEGRVTVNGVSLEPSNSPQPLTVVDSLNRVLIDISPNGAVFAHNLELSTAEIIGFNTIVVDSVGRILAGVATSGVITIEGLGTPATAPPTVVVTPPWVTMLPLSHVDSPLMTIINYGQSNSRGTGPNESPALTTTQPYTNKMLTGGVRTDDAVAAGTRASTLTPLVEANTYDTSPTPVLVRGETPSSATCNYLTQLLGGSAYGKSFVSFAPGQGGRPLYGLTNGLNKPSNGIWFTQLVADLQRVQTAATNLGQQHSVPGWTFIQGEEDTDNLFDPRLYAKYLVEMQNDFCDLVNATTGQTFRPVLVCSQVAAHRDYGKEVPAIALAQYQATQQRNDIVLSAPGYCLEYRSDLLHLTNEGAKMLGHYMALALKRAVFDKNTTTCLRPNRVFRRDATTVDVVFGLVHGPIRINTAWVSDIRNKGFDIRQADNTVRDIITAVSIIGDDTVRLTTSSPVAVGDKVVYGWGRNGDATATGRTTGPRGNICDSQGDVYQYVGADTVTRRLDNYSIMFQVPI